MFTTELLSEVPEVKENYHIFAPLLVSLYPSHMLVSPGVSLQV